MEGDGAEVTIPVAILYPPVEVFNRKDREEVRTWIAAHKDLADLPIQVDIDSGRVRDGNMRYLAHSENIHTGWAIFGVVLCCLAVLAFIVVLVYTYCSSY